MYSAILPEWFWLSIIFIFGLVIGSFLNVVIYRFHTGKSLNDRSHCLSCGEQLAWYELFPVFSYLVLLGRCKNCGSYIPYRYLLVELLTAVAFVTVWLSTDSYLTFFLTLFLVSVLIVGVVYDLYHMIIPNEVVLASAFLAILIVVASTPLQKLPLALTFAAFSSLIAFGFFASLWYFSGGKWVGFGDAKLAAGLGFLTNISQVFSLLVFSFWIGALVSIFALAMQMIFLRGQPGLRILPGTLTMKSEIPFAPFLVSAFVLVYFFGLDVLSLTTYALTVLYGPTIY